jgi:hypothetical protein
MTDNEEIQYQLTISHLQMFDVPMHAVENVDLTNGQVQAHILDCLTKEQITNVLASHGGEKTQHGH